MFENAAVQGSTGSRIKLGYMYANGLGVKKNLETAYAWISAASRAGDRRGDYLIPALQKNSMRNSSPLLVGKPRARPSNRTSNCRRTLLRRRHLPSQGPLSSCPERSYRECESQTGSRRRPMFTDVG